MTNPSTSRRGFLKGTITTALGGTLLAGCIGQQTGSNRSGTETGTSGTGSYTVSLAPMGEVSFNEVPKNWLANNGSWADMGIALGQQPPKGVWLTERYHTQYYKKIPGVSVDTSSMQSLYSDGVSKEVFYDVDADVHVMDPNFVLNRFKGLKQSDINTIKKNVGPFFGNSIYSRSYNWHKYRYYTLYEAFKKLADVFQEQQRYAAFQTLHDNFQKTLTSHLPPKKERSSVAIFWAKGNTPKSFLPYIIDAGTSYKQWRDLGVRDALAKSDVKNFHSARKQIGYETMLQIDPEVLLLRGHENQSKSEFQKTVVSFMKEHPVASQLQAVKNDNVFRGGPLYQGPITNLVLTERAAKQVYPDAFKDVTLFDPQRVGDIVAGRFDAASTATP